MLDLFTTTLFALRGYRWQHHRYTISLSEITLSPKLIEYINTFFFVLLLSLNIVISCCIVLYSSSSMVQQPNTGTWPPVSVSQSCDILRAEVVRQYSNPQSGRPGLHIYGPWRKDCPGITLGTG